MLWSKSQTAYNCRPGLCKFSNSIERQRFSFCETPAEFDGSTNRILSPYSFRWHARQSSASRILQNCYLGVQVHSCESFHHRYLMAMRPAIGRYDPDKRFGM